MPTIDLPSGSIAYASPDRSSQPRPPVVFVHAFLVNGAVWSDDAELPRRTGHPVLRADWPLGAHRTPMHPTPTSRRAAWPG